MSEINQNDKGTRLWILALILILVAAIWGLSGWFLYPMGSTERGTFGDMFGAVNSLFSGLAFATLIFTVFMQREELSLQRKELEYTRIELRRSATAQEQSEAALKAQAESASRSANLAAINALLNFYQADMAYLKKHSLHRVQPGQRQFETLEMREVSLRQILDATYRDLVSGHHRREQELAEEEDAA